MHFYRRGIAAFTALLLLPATFAQSIPPGPPALPPDARRVLMAPISEDNAALRARLIKVLQDRRKKLFKDEYKRFQDFETKLRKGKYGKFLSEKVNSPYLLPYDDPEYIAFRRVRSALEEWRRVVTEEERYYLDIIEDGRRDTWELVASFVEYSVIRAQELGYGYQNMVKETRALQDFIASPQTPPLVKEFATTELAADNGILQAGRHRQLTIQLILETLHQGPPEAHQQRYRAWLAQGQAAASARARQVRQDQEDFAFMLGGFLATWAAIGIAGGGGGSVMPSNELDCKVTHHGTWFDNEGLGFCVGYD